MSAKPELAGLYSKHLTQLLDCYSEAFEAAKLGSGTTLIIHSGSQHYYASDDRAVPFQAFGHFLHWVPLNRPDQLLLIKPGQIPQLLQMVPTDYWHDQRMEQANWWTDYYQCKSLPSFEALADELKTRATEKGQRYIYLGGDHGELSRQLGLELEQAANSLLHFLDYRRAYKSDYEITQLSEANRRGVAGHAAARDAFLQGGSELQIHQAYLAACGILEDQSPYTNIVGLDSNAAILHYQNKSTEAKPDSKVLLIDAGYRHYGYGSDITRTWTRPGVDEQFASLVQGVIAIERNLVGEVRPGLRYTDLHQSTIDQLADLLIELEIVHGDKQELLDRHIVQRFMPHGTGHLLGIQVHDVGGHQQDERGSLISPPSATPALRLTRQLEEGMVFTIEPGCYFIPMLLEPLREHADGKLIDFSCVDRLYQFGGVRIEDNIQATSGAARNLTREHEEVASAA